MGPKVGYDGHNKDNTEKIKNALFSNHCDLTSSEKVSFKLGLVEQAGHYIRLRQVFFGYVGKTGSIIVFTHFDFLERSTAWAHSIPQDVTHRRTTARKLHLQQTKTVLQMFAYLCFMRSFSALKMHLRSLFISIIILSYIIIRDRKYIH